MLYSLNPSIGQRPRRLVDCIGMHKTRGYTGLPSPSFESSNGHKTGTFDQTTGDKPSYSELLDTFSETPPSNRNEDTQVYNPQQGNTERLRLDPISQAVLDRLVSYLCRDSLSLQAINSAVTSQRQMCCSNRPSRREHRGAMIATRAASDFLTAQSDVEKRVQPTPYPSSIVKSVQDSPPPYGAIDQKRGERDLERANTAYTQPTPFVPGQTAMIAVATCAECAQNGHQVSLLPPPAHRYLPLALPIGTTWSKPMSLVCRSDADTAQKESSGGIIFFPWGLFW